jgi:adenylate cyclase
MYFLLIPRKGTTQVIELKEGVESNDFWKALGGKSISGYEYSRNITPQMPPARMWHCTNSTGLFQVTEVFHYSQDSLDNGDMYILDAHHSLFVWMGNGANEDEKKRSMETAMVRTCQHVIHVHQYQGICCKAERE